MFSIKIFSHPYPLLESRSFKLLLCLGGSLFFLLFLWIFEPFGMFLFTREQTPVIFGYIGIALTLWVFHLFFLQKFFKFQWTVGSTILWLSWINFIIGIAITFFNNFVYDYDRLDIGHFLVVQWVGWTVGIIPIIFIVFIHENYLLKKRSKEADLLSISNSQRITKLDRSQKVVFPAENPKNNLILNRDSVLYLTSEDNYVAIYFEDGEKVKREFIRNSLKELENILPQQHFLRCHKSYIVNLNKIARVSGNAAGYKFHFESLPTEIPVSRSLNKKVFSILNS